jgi:hypothetical protein
VVGLVPLAILHRNICGAESSTGQAAQDRQHRTGSTDRQHTVATCTRAEA